MDISPLQPVSPPQTPNTPPAAPPGSEPQVIGPSQSAPLFTADQLAGPATSTAAPVSPMPDTAPPAPTVIQPSAESSPTVVSGVAATAPLDAASVYPNSGQNQPPAGQVFGTNTGTVSPSNKRFSKKTLLITAAVVLLAAVPAAALVAKQMLTASPDKVFNQALVNSFSTNSLTQQGTDTEGDISSTITTKYDVHDLSNITVSSDNRITSSGDTEDLVSYGNTKNSYMKTSVSDNVASELGFQAVNSKWVQFRKDGQAPSAADPVGIGTADPRDMFFGNLIFGNFSAKDRQSLLDYLSKNKVYTYDAAKVTSKNVSGVSAYVYDVKIDTTKLTDFNKLVAKTINLPSSVISQDTLDSINNIPEATFYADKQHKRIIKVEVNNKTMKATVNYSAYNSTTLPAEPKADLSFDQYLNLSGEAASASGGADTTSSANDTTRKTDINVLHGQLEAFQAINGFYPTLANINDPAWRAANMQGLDAIALKDPAGSSSVIAAKPAAKVYSYDVAPAGCDNGSKGDCTSYTLTATLDAGGTYVKQSLN